MVEQLVSFLGAMMILAAYAGQQTGKLQPASLIYLLLNLAGSIILAVIAFRVRQLGLTILETAWALITLLALAKRKSL